MKTVRKDYNETWLLIGLFRDLQHYRHHKKCREQREQIGKKLKVRWRKGIDRDAFEQYFEDHQIDKSEVGL